MNVYSGGMSTNCWRSISYLLVKCSPKQSKQTATLFGKGVRPFAFEIVETCRQVGQLGVHLNLQVYLPKQMTDHREAIRGYCRLRAISVTQGVRV